MLSNFRRRIGLFYSRIRFLSEPENIRSFGYAVTKAERAIIIFPEQMEDHRPLQGFLNQFVNHAQLKSISIVVRKDILKFLRQPPNVNIISYVKEDVNSFFVPRRLLRDKIHRTSFDLALDLNTGFSFTSAFICRESRAPVRVSFYKEHGEQFYNIQLRTRRTKDLHLPYQNLMKCLQMF
jgi:hypothetical protein